MARKRHPIRIAQQDTPKTDTQFLQELFSVVKKYDRFARKQLLFIHHANHNELDKNSEGYKKLSSLTQNKAAMFVHAATNITDTLSTHRMGAKNIKNTMKKTAIIQRKEIWAKKYPVSLAEKRSLQVRLHRQSQSQDFLSL